MLLLAVFLATGCGSSESSTTQVEGAAHPTAETPSLNPGAAARAESICEESVRETTLLGRRLAQALAGSPSDDAIGSELVVPGIRILERELSRLERLEAAADSSEFDVYVDLFDPIIELAEQRVEAGRTDEPERGQALERLIAGLVDEQVAIARKLELGACSVGFTEALGGQR